MITDTDIHQHHNMKFHHTVLTSIYHDIIRLGVAYTPTEEPPSVWEGRLGLTKLEVGTKIEANYKALGKYYPGKVRLSITKCTIITITITTIISSLIRQLYPTQQTPLIDLCPQTLIESASDI